jgi:heavy metal sensor kinase
MMFDFFKKKSKISWKITVLYVLMFMMLLFLINIAIYFFLSNFISDNIRKSISNTSEFVVSQLGSVSNPIGYYDAGILQDISRSEENIYFRILENNGEVRAQSRYLRNLDIPITDDISEFRTENRFLAVNTIKLDNFPFSSGYLQVVRDITFEKNFLDFLILVLTVSAAVGSLLSVFLGYFTTKKMLSPINQITETAREISFSDLDRRLSVRGPDDELKKLAVTFNSMLDRLESSFKSQKQFVSDASHELRTPISVIKGYVDLLDRWGKEKPEVRDEAIQAIKNETENMKHLIENLLLLARGDDSELIKEEEEFDVNNLISSIIKEFQLMEEDVDFKYLEKGKIKFFGDSNLFKQLFRIFIENAVKFTSREGKITIIIDDKDEDLFFSIEDNGPGIEKENLPYVFDRFYQADKSRSRKKEGSGLGLAIAKQIVDSYDGEIKVKSSPGEGSKFIIRMPIN